ncbi:MAG TPA: D-alanyl-D-alanine carboxypeptidase/D-alanyl-D-alanine-endopeptidase, partial [Thermoanaerobaculia bacterium]|nr:D-alanyl-D-alanine carboxypeptidase/D-alanyl-D-alanine-endopeptidase [Thermoanaerobaculia bacterium]
LERETLAAHRVARELGVRVVDLADRREVFAAEADQPRILASNTKLMTTAAALAELGPDFVYETRVLIRGRVEQGALEGDLAVLGSGDPNLSGRFHDGDAYAIFRGWARSLAARGVRRVGGDLLLVNGLFEEPRVHPDWPRDQLTTWYEAPVDALSFSDNCVLVRVRPGARAGAPARVETVPPLDYFRIRNSARTSNDPGRLFVTREDAADVVVVSGTVGRRSAGTDVWVAVYDPPAYFGAALRDALAGEGIEVAGGTRPVHGLPEGVWEEVTRHVSDLPTTLAVPNKRSQNFYAESLLKLLGRRLRGDGSWPGGTAAVRSTMARLGLDPDRLELADGSGLSRANRASARSMTDLLERMYFHAYGREFVRSLPHSGEEGLSWQRRLATGPYRGNVFAKTGTLRGVSTLSGYARAVSGRVYAFSILLNQVRSGADARAAQDRIVRALIDRG